MKIEVLGMGCCGCEKLYEAVREVMAELGVNGEVIKVEDMKEILQRGVMTTPALLIDGKVKISGRVPSKDELRKIMA